MRVSKRLLRIVPFIFIAIIYTYLVWTVNKTPLVPTPYAYFNYLVNAFLHGRVYITPSWTYDLSLFDNKWFLYWGPAPTLFVLPFYLFSRLQTSDIIYTLVAGILNCYLFYFVLKEVITYFKVKLSTLSFYTIFLSFAFASPNFYLAMNAKVWETDQVIATFYLLFFLFFLFRYLNHLKNTRLLVLSLIFFHLAWLSRYTLLFYGLLYMFPLYLFYTKKQTAKLKKILKVTVVGVLIGLGVFFAYNYARFGNIFETGIHYQTANQRFITDIKNGLIFSTKNLAHNFSFYFLNHMGVSFERPYVHIDIEGNSVFSVYPFLLFLFGLIGAKIYKDSRVKVMLMLFYAVVFINLTLLMLTLGTGWIQFGNRYFLDVIPLLFLSGIFIVGSIPFGPKILVLCYGFVVNIVGILTFFNKL